MKHFIIGVVLGVLGGALTRQLGAEPLVALLVGGGIALLYWLIVALIKGKLKDIDLEMPDFGGD